MCLICSISCNFARGLVQTVNEPSLCLQTHSSSLLVRSLPSMHFQLNPCSEGFWTHSKAYFLLLSGNCSGVLLAELKNNPEERERLVGICLCHHSLSWRYTGRNVRWEKPCCCLELWRSYVICILPFYVIHTYLYSFCFWKAKLLNAIHLPCISLLLTSNQRTKYWVEMLLSKAI